MREGEGKYIGKKLKKRKNVSETHRWGDSRIDPLFKSGKVVDCVENLRTAIPLRCTTPLEPEGGQRRRAGVFKGSRRIRFFEFKRVVDYVEVSKETPRR